MKILLGWTRPSVQGAFPGDEPVSEWASAVAFGHVTQAFCGPEQRTVQTGQLPGLEAAIEPAIRDCDYGQWCGKTLDEVSATDPQGLQDWLTDPQSAPHQGESVSVLLQRMSMWLDETAFQAGRIAVVTHPAVIRAAVVHAIDARPQSFWRIDIAPLSRTVLTGRSGRWNLKELSPVAH